MFAWNWCPWSFDQRILHNLQASTTLAFFLSWVHSPSVDGRQLTVNRHLLIGPFLSARAIMLSTQANACHRLTSHAPFIFTQPSGQRFTTSCHNGRSRGNEGDIDPGLYFKPSASFQEVGGNAAAIHSFKYPRIMVYRSRREIKNCFPLLYNISFCELVQDHRLESLLGGF